MVPGLKSLVTFDASHTLFHHLKSIAVIVPALFHHFKSIAFIVPALFYHFKSIASVFEPCFITLRVCFHCSSHVSSYPDYCQVRFKKCSPPPPRLSFDPNQSVFTSNVVAGG